MKLFLRSTHRRTGLILSFLWMACSFAYSQTPIPSSIRQGYPLAVPTAEAENTAYQEPTSVRSLKKERRKLQKLSNLLKSRAMGTNILLSNSELATQQKTQHLIESLSEEIDRVRKVRHITGKEKDRITLASEHKRGQALSHYRPKSSELAEKALPATKKIEKLESIPHLDQVKTFRPDSASVDQLIQNLVQRTKYGQQVEKLQSSQALAEQTQSQLLDKEMSALQDKQQLQRYAEAKAAKLATSEFSQISPQLQQAQQKFANYKKRMQWLKEGSGKHANSLKGDSLSKRMIYGGNFQITSLQPFSIVLAPYVGYRLNKKISVGISMSYKSILGKNTLPTKSFGGEIAFRGFTEYKMIKSWFAHIEVERMNTSVTNSRTEGYHTESRNNGYIGIGKQIGSIKGMKFTSVLLCNLFDSRVRTLHPAVFQFRFGISK